MTKWPVEKNYACYGQTCVLSPSCITGPYLSNPPIVLTPFSDYDNINGNDNAMDRHVLSRHNLVMCNRSNFHLIQKIMKMSMIFRKENIYLMVQTKKSTLALGPNRRIFEHPNSALASHFSSSKPILATITKPSALIFVKLWSVWNFKPSTVKSFVVLQGPINLYSLCRGNLSLVTIYIIGSIRRCLTYL